MIHINAKAILSAFIGVLCAFFAYPILKRVIPEDAFLLSLLCGLLFALLLFPALAIVERRARRKYSAFEKTIDSPIRYTVNGNFSLGKRVRNGNLYFCDDRIVMASADENPFIEKQIPAQDIEKFEFGNGRMTICLKDGTNVSIATAQAAEIPQLLSALGWAKQTTL